MEKCWEIRCNFLAFTEVVGLISFYFPLTIVCPLALFFSRNFFGKILRDRCFEGVRHLPDQNLKKWPEIKILKFMQEKKARGHAIFRGEVNPTTSVMFKTTHYIWISWIGVSFVFHSIEDCCCIFFCHFSSFIFQNFRKRIQTRTIKSILFCNFFCKPVIVRFPVRKNLCSIEHVQKGTIITSRTSFHHWGLNVTAEVCFKTIDLQISLFTSWLPVSV